MKWTVIIPATLLFLLVSCNPPEEKTLWLDELDLTKMETGWGVNNINKSVDGNVLTIGGREFERGVGTHAISKLMVGLDGKGVAFRAFVGVDDESEIPAASIEFFVLGDKEILWQSGKMTAADTAREVNVDLSGIDKLALLVTDAGDGINYDHADWAEAYITTKGVQPTIISVSPEAGEPYILTPPVPDTPRINGARITGASPNKPFMFKVPITGLRPMEISAENLPEGLVIDNESGLITGRAGVEGDYKVSITAKNELGEDKKDLKIVIGKHKLALTPPMGWNSWNSWACTIDQEKTRAAADAMVKSGLAEHGWTYINIDDCWEAEERTSEGELLCNEKFPDIKGLSEYIHSLGLKIGIYSSPGPTTCQGLHGSWQHELQDAETWAGWGIDYLKYDWCGYFNVVEDNSLEAYKRPYFVMRDALDQVDRDIIYSLCQYGMKEVWTWGEEVGGDLWRTTGDIVDTWNSLYSIGFSQDKNAKFASPSNWNDPDMLIVGYVGWSENLHPTRLTPDEQYTHISLWSLLSSPMLIGCDMDQLDDFTMNLLSNDEVLAVNQDMLGQQAVPLLREGGLEVWAKDLADGSKAVGIFYTGASSDDPLEMFAWEERIDSKSVILNWEDIGLEGTHQVRDLWRQKDLGEFKNQFKTEVPYHGVKLIKVE